MSDKLPTREEYRKMKKKKLRFRKWVIAVFFVFFLSILLIGSIGIYFWLNDNNEIDKIQEKLIKQAFSGNETETKNANQSQTENHEVSDLVSVLHTTISVLKAELEAKDRQIEKLQMLLDQEQQLHALTAQQIKELPEQKEPDMTEEKKWWQFWK